MKWLILLWVGLIFLDVLKRTFIIDKTTYVYDYETDSYKYALTREKDD